jgi:hypothetical protein
MALALGIGLPVGLAGEPKEKSVVEQILDLLLQRGQISQEEYRTLQEKTNKSKLPPCWRGLRKANPF